MRGAAGVSAAPGSPCPRRASGQGPRRNAGRRAEGARGPAPPPCAGTDRGSRPLPGAGVGAGARRRQAPGRRPASPLSSPRRPAAPEAAHGPGRPPAPGARRPGQGDRRLEPGAHLLSGAHVVLAEQAADALREGVDRAAVAVLLGAAAAPRPLRARGQQPDEQQKQQEPSPGPGPARGARAHPGAGGMRGRSGAEGRTGDAAAPAGTALARSGGCAPRLCQPPPPLSQRHLPRPARKAATALPTPRPAPGRGVPTNDPPNVPGNVPARGRRGRRLLCLPAPTECVCGRLTFRKYILIFIFNFAVKSSPCP